MANEGKYITTAYRSLVGHHGLTIIICLGISSILIIPLIILVLLIVANKTYKVDIYEDRVVTSGGLLTKKVRTRLLTTIISVNLHQTFTGRLFNFGSVYVNLVGVEKLNLEAYKDPELIANVFEKRIKLGQTLEVIM